MFGLHVLSVGIIMDNSLSSALNDQETLKMQLNKWTVADIIDLEYFLGPDYTPVENMAVKKRDREIYLSTILSEGRKKVKEAFRDSGVKEKKGIKVISPRHLIRMWLGKIREMEREKKNDTLFPGRIYEDTIRLLNIIFALTGILMGASLCTAFFSYTGNNPLNVSYFLALILFPQFFFIVLLAGRFIGVNVGFFSRGAFFTPIYIIRLVDVFIRFVGKKINRSLTPGQREKTEIVSGMLRAGHEIYGSVFFWPFFILMQLLGTGFYLSILFLTLFRVVFFDIAFGWQSTIQLGAEGVQKIVELIAVPWSWFLPETLAYPSLEQIEGSRMILKDGIFHLATGDLIAWWPFLCFVVIFYGLLPRILLLGAGYRFLLKSLKNLNFDHGNCALLVRRMTTPLSSTDSHTGVEKITSNLTTEIDSPLVSTLLQESAMETSSDVSACTDDLSLEDTTSAVSVSQDFESSQRTEPEKALIIEKEIVSGAEKPCIAIVQEDIYGEIDMDALENTVKKSLGFAMKRVVQIGLDYDQLMGDIRQCLDEGVTMGKFNADFSGLILVQEAWQPPIRETIQFIQELRKAAGKNTHIVIGLIGKPANETVLTVTDEADFEIWYKKAVTIGDPFLTVEKLVKI